jgi:hypothetical protein
MGVAELVRWQWDGYPRYHRSRFNLMLHILVVPVFLIGNVGVIIALANGAWAIVAGCTLAMVFSIALQGRGHKKEPVPPESFTGAGNAVARIFLEQWLTFPRFVLSGGWLHALRLPAA